MSYDTNAIGEESFGIVVWDPDVGIFGHVRWWNRYPKPATRKEAETALADWFGSSHISMESFGEPHRLSLPLKIADFGKFDVFSQQSCRKAIRHAVSERLSLARALRGMEETVDNIREALGFEATHYLVLPDDVREIVEAIDAGGKGRAFRKLQELRERNRVK